MILDIANGVSVVHPMADLYVTSAVCDMYFEQCKKYHVCITSKVRNAIESGNVGMLQTSPDLDFFLKALMKGGSATRYVNRSEKYLLGIWAVRKCSRKP
jgi:hypothetical protein